MKTSNLHGILPCAALFSRGRTVQGLAALLMQLSLVFWPAASRWSRRLTERAGVEEHLAAFADAYGPPAEKYAAPAKKFRQLA
jgi:hypothetical protein